MQKSPEACAFGDSITRCYYKPLNGTEARPVCKCFVSRVDDEKMTFSEISNIVVEHFCDWRVGIFGGRTACFSRSVGV